ncbi:MAG: ParB/RepB/Spo0J family partition protein [Pseudomonadota bacterium]
MTKKHSAIFDDVLSGLDADQPPEDRAGARFLQRSTRVAERLSGEIEEKTLRRVDPALCRMWDRHNRTYELLTEDNCRDLIDGIRSQGRQEFPAVVRATGDADRPYEVICGARRHFAVSWLRANNYPQFKYLIEVRDLTDEEAFRLADIENRDREDISDYERARDYLDALDRYYGGEQKAMAERLEMSRAYLSRFLQLARLPQDIVAAFASIRDIRELHARTLKPHLAPGDTREALLAEARAIVEEGRALPPADVMTRLTAVTKPAPDPTLRPIQFVDDSGQTVGLMRLRRGKVFLEFSHDVSPRQLQEGFDHVLQTLKKGPRVR